VNFDALFDEVFPPLYRYCHRLIGDPDAAEDVAQEAFVRLLDRNVSGEPVALRVWLFKVATHLIRDRWRVTENRRRLLEINPVTPGAEPDPEVETERGQEIANVRAALAELDPRDRELLLMREEGFSYKEMAEAVGVAATSVGTLVSRAQKRFTDAWTARIGADGEAPLARGEG
jgi:RNA polymerase sigma factor (sigma-70 family)